VLSESILLPRNESLYLDIFAPHRVIFVGVYCPLAEALRREQRRVDRRRPLTIDPAMFDLVHAHGTYDLVVDTARLTPGEAARRITAVLDLAPSPTAFERLRAVRHRGER